MSRNLKNIPGFNPPSSDKAPSGMKNMDPSPGGGKIKNIKGPSIYSSDDTGGDDVNNDGVDSGTSVISK